MKKLLFGHASHLVGSWVNWVWALIVISSPFSAAFTQNTIKGYTYWFNQNTENAVTVQLNTPSQRLHLQERLQVPGNLPEGVHFIHFRFFDDSGYGSSVLQRAFFKWRVNSKISRWAWQIDTLPAKIEVFTSPEATQWIQTALDASTLQPGLHTVTFRVEDNRGIWSAPYRAYVYRLPSCDTTQIIRTRTWFNNADSLLAEKVIEPNSGLFITDTLNTTHLVDTANHEVHTQFMDVCGRWSVVYTKRFYKGPSPQPQALFSDTLACPWQPIRFVNQSSFADSVLWDFGDGATSSDTNPSYQYSQPGVYSIQLKAINTVSGLDSTVLYADTITIQAPPQAQILTNADTVTSLCDTLQLSSTAILRTTVQWLLDGNIVQGATNNSLLVQKSGKYQVVKTDPLGCSDTSTAVTALIGYTGNILIQARGNTLSTNIPDPENYRFQWFLNGNAIPGATTPELITRNAGNYTVEVANDAGCKGISPPFNGFVPTSNDNPLSTPRVLMYPNPANEFITIKAENIHEIVTIKIYSLLGNGVVEYPNMQNIECFVIPTDHLPAGVYYMVVQSSRFTFSEKILIVH